MESIIQFQVLQDCEGNFILKENELEEGKNCLIL